jgi:leader peptidase (prepilin peptidase)/N-methyltransferase
VTWHLDTALACAFYGLFVGQLVPLLIARVPEPEPEAAAEEEDASPLAPDPADGEVSGLEVTDEVADVAPVVADPKELYVDIARRRGLRWKASLATALVSGLLGAAVGWSPALSFLLYLAPVGVALAVIDWRTRLLPTKVIAPSYFVVAALAAVSAWAEGDLDALITAGLGWLVAGGTFFLMWFVYPRGMGYGDVRLSGILGIALGYLGWSELLVGVYAGFIVGGLSGLLLSLLRLVDRKAYPFGPFMLIGAVVGVLLGPYVAEWYAYP